MPVRIALLNTMLLEHDAVTSDKRPYTPFTGICDWICENLTQSCQVQYKPMITMCKILAYLKKNIAKFFLVKKESCGINLYIILFAYSRGA